MWAERTVSCKKCMSVHMLRETYHPAPYNLTNKDSHPDNGDIALASIKSGGGRVNTKGGAQNSSTIAASVLGG